MTMLVVSWSSRTSALCRRAGGLAAVAAVAVVPVPASACLWDKDTLAMENQRFPEVRDLIAGKFLRHSEAFYRWRVDDRRAKLAAQPSAPTQAEALQTWLGWRDDLAVALHALGEHAEAVELMRGSDGARPDRYETHANWGTFLLHGGDLREGLVHIDRAIAINADAHFGREVYQKLLVEYVLARRSAGAGLPMMAAAERNLFNYDTGRGHDGPPRAGFLSFVLARRGLETGAGAGDTSDESEAVRAERMRALKGVAGMLRFSDHRSPILLEALGDLLTYTTPMAIRDDAKLLAARAYLAAARVSPAAASAYVDLAREILHLHHKKPPEEVRAALEREIAAADAWFAKIAANEAKWIAAGKDPEAMFERTYYRR